MGSCAAPSAKGDDKFITTDYLQQCRMFIVSAARADEATAIMATNDTRIFFMVGSPVFTYPNNQWLITGKAVDLRAG
jgi:hypothetical protein